MAKVDIVVPCYNYGRYLESCVASVLDQSISDLRVLIIDDASSDDSLAVARRLASADSRVSVIGHAVNMGHIETYNEGIEWASSDYFLLLSADDLLVPGALQRAIEIMDANPGVALTFGDCVAWFDAERAPEINHHASFTWEQFDLLKAICASATNLVPTPTAIVRTSVQQSSGGYRKSLPHAGDMEMWLRFAANGAVARINAVQAIYRLHANSMSQTFSPRSWSTAANASWPSRAFSTSTQAGWTRASI
jgi:GT2 family glycosyltransferase